MTQWKNRLQEVMLDTELHPRDTIGRFSEKKGQAPAVTLSDEEIRRFYIEEGEQQDFTRDDLRDTAFPYDRVWVENDDGTLYIEGETEELDLAGNIYGSLPESERAAQLTKDWKRIARCINETYGDFLNEDSPSTKAMSFTVQLGELEGGSITSARLRNLGYNHEDGEGMARAIRTGDIYEVIRNNFGTAAEEGEDEDEDI